MSDSLGRAHRMSGAGGARNVTAPGEGLVEGEGVGHGEGAGRGEGVGAVTGRRRALACLVVLAALGCKRKGGDAGPPAGGSKPFHAPGAFVHGAEPWQWIAPTKEFATGFLASKGFPEDALLPETHVATARMQAWLDRLFDALLEQAKSDASLLKAMNTMPRPTVRITSDAVMNAWVLGAPLCLEVTARLAPGVATPTRESKPAPRGTPRLTYDYKKRTFTTAFENDGCPSSIVVPAGDYAKWFNAKKLSCTLAIEGGVLVFPTACLEGGKAPSNVTDGTMFRAIRITSTVPVIVFGKAMLQRARKEEHAVGILAHELGHVLKSHYTSEDSGYDYFYRHTDRDEAGKPEPDPAMRALGERLQDVSNDIMFFSVQGGRFDPSLFQGNLGFASGASGTPACAGAGECAKACGELQAYVESTEFQPIASAQSAPIFMGGAPVFPLARLPDVQRAPYLRFEEKLAACSKAIPVPAGSDGDPAGVWASLASGTPGFVGAHLAGVRGSIATRLDLMEAIGKAYVDREKARAGLYAEALDMRLGFYTVEQESDELALEFLAAGGLPASSFPDFEMELGAAKEKEEGPPRYDLTHAQCAALRAAGWKDAGGKPVRIPLGSVADTHHGSCYRVFNAEREIVRHGWLTGSAGSDGVKGGGTMTKKPAFEPTWDVIKKAL